MLGKSQCLPAAAATAVFLCLVLFSKFHVSDSKPSGFSLRLIPSNSLCPRNLSQSERIEQLTRISNAKADFAKKLLWTSNATSEAEKFIVGVYPTNSLYAGEVFIGTPPVTMLLLIDTGGGLVWTQCEPCINCYPLRYPLYNSQASSTYKKLPCDHPLCHGDSSPYECVNGECTYTIYYGGFTSGPTKGVASLETFAFRIGDGSQGITISDVIFGCSNDNQNFPQFAQNGLVSGILGLSLSPDSLFIQLSTRIDNRFSYCFPPFTRNKVPPAVLRFGDDIPPRPDNIQTTPYNKVPAAYYFFLNLNDISIGLNSLGFPPATFDLQHSGLFIDSGAPLTRLVTTTVNGVNVFQTVMTALQNHYDSFQLERVPDNEKPRPEFSLCYRNREGFGDFASMTFHFQGANYVVDPNYTNINFDGGIFCIAILPTQGVNILGAWHMQNMRIIHNGHLQAIQFYPDQCADDHL